jgi:hypothetical protein
VNDEIISNNEEYRVHILKYMEIFTNIHTKSDQGEITAHNFHLGRCPKFGHWVPRAQCDIYIFGLKNGSRDGSLPRVG